MRFYNRFARALVTLADSSRSAVGSAAYLVGLPVAHVLATAADWCGYREPYEVHAAILRVEERIIAWSQRRAPDGRVVAPRSWRCP